MFACGTYLQVKLREIDIPVKRERLMGCSGAARYEPSLAATGLGRCCASNLELHDTVCPFRSVFGHKRTP
jgi:hypothetical protein